MKSSKRSSEVDPNVQRSVAVDLALLVAIVLAGYFLKIGNLPVLGEEGRRARASVEMIESGDWTVVRLGGVVFPDRPPMSNWLIAVAGQARGGVDKLAIRLPSALAILALTLGLYAYGRGTGQARLPAFAAAAVFPTLGQVLELGGRGESEAVFTLFLAGGLLAWHLVETRGGPPAFGWLAGYALTACAALTKGLQAPIYFVAVVAVYLVWTGRARRLFGIAHLAGIAVFLAIVGAWQVPFLLATDVATVRATWLDVVGPRVGWGGLLEHIATYPFEILTALLPWSAAFVALASPSIRRALAPSRVVVFAAIAIAVTFPSVWLSRGAETRYYLPIYPFFAILIGEVLGALGRAPAGSFARRFRDRFGQALLLAIAVGAALVVLPRLGDDGLLPYRQTPLWTAALLVLAVVTGKAVYTARANGSDRMRRAVACLALFLALLYSLVWGSVIVIRRVDHSPRVEAARTLLPDDADLVSLGPIDSTFAYHYADFIREIPWPEQPVELPADVEFFCFERRPEHTEETRTVWRGMKTWTTPGTLPFQWIPVAQVPIGRRVNATPSATIVIGRVSAPDDPAL